MSDHHRGAPGPGQEHGHHHKGGVLIPEKLEKLLAHWIRHNEEHAATYLQWAERARNEGLFEVADILEAVAGESRQTNQRLAHALRILEGR